MISPIYSYLLCVAMPPPNDCMTHCIVQSLVAYPFLTLEMIETVTFQWKKWAGLKWNNCLIWKEDLQRSLPDMIVLVE